MCTQKKIIHRIIAMVCTFIMMLCFICNVIPLKKGVVTPTMVFATNTQVDKILAYGRSLIGSTNYNGYCQRFVRLCYEAGGISTASTGVLGAGNAREAFNRWHVSTSKENIPVGATMYFNTSSDGHVAIYTGNNTILHAVAQVKEQTISDRYWELYLGWGYQLGVQPTGTYIDNLEDECLCTEDGAGNYEVIANDVKLRSGHDTLFPSITNIPNGETIYVSKTDGSWAHVEWNGYEGYVSLSYLKRLVKITDSGHEDPYEISDYLFDATFYADKYPDLYEKYGYDENLLYEHWCNYGIAEGRCASPYFDPIYYVNNNSGISQTLGTDYSKVYQHFLNYGCNDNNMKLSLIYDAPYYENAYTSLSSYSPVERFKYFIEKGIYQSQRASKEFNPIFYRNNNTDLLELYGTSFQKYYFHYVAKGYDEGRLGYDIEEPSIDNVNVSIDYSKSLGYSIDCTIDDNIEVTKVEFQTWSTYMGQIDLTIDEVIPIDNTCHYEVKVSDHNDYVGPYNTYISVYDEEGNCTIVPVTAIIYHYGDVTRNGITNYLDVLLVKKYLIGIDTISEEQLSLADLNNDGIVNIIDFMMLNNLVLDNTN